MTVTAPTIDQNELESLRREIDALDREMHTLLMRRFEVTGRVAALKRSQQSANNWRPGRQAQLLRALVSRHNGSCPDAALVRVWQEIMGASLALQGSFSVGIFADKAGELWNLARDHFGSYIVMSEQDSTEALVGAVAAGDLSVAVVPAPGNGEASPWWLAITEQPGLRAVARLPLFDTPNRRDSQGGDAFALARLDAEETGDDCTLLAVLGDADEGALLAALGGEGRVLAAADTQDGRWRLVEIDRFLSPDTSLSLPASLHRYCHLGCYAAPYRG
ncbi:chorismate mutase [Oceanibaculum indicum]|uniref:chorismate mutase n=1 Tax=Oceanibaculum indicum P24 TaxID=1207063 RepID=K2K7N9_9PROT|nr:chorismate mutase [Oceanibaculum indicum]EKE78899.1 chorismate mutase [Oceanibaculum indicum P24]